MPRDLRPMLNETEQALLRETERLDELDEDALADLHDRIRRARNKYTKLYRRRASAQVSSDAARARAHATHAKAVAKAELFEDALARVSRQLAAEAKAAAAALKRERLALAKGEPVAAGATPRAASTTGATKASSTRPTTRTPATEKRRASTKATTKRRQTARDRRVAG